MVKNLRAITYWLTITNRSKIDRCSYNSYITAQKYTYVILLRGAWFLPSTLAIFHSALVFKFLIPPSWPKPYLSHLGLCLISPSHSLGLISPLTFRRLILVVVSDPMTSPSCITKTCSILPISTFFPTATSLSLPHRWPRPRGTHFLEKLPSAHLYMYRCI